jgi:tetratricopeptide (TPR) repeat protein
LCGLTLAAAGLADTRRELWAASHFETERLYFAGRYEEAAEIARQEVARGVWNELWPDLQIRSLLALGRYDEARAVYEASLKRYGDRIGYRLLGAQVYRFVNRAEEAERQLRQFEELVQRSPWRFGSSRDQVILGRYFAMQGEDGRQILELIYDRVRKQNPQYAEVYIAAAELALEKHDHGLAAEQLKAAAELQPYDPYVFYLQAKAHQDQADDQAAAALQKALELNPRHVPSLLLQADQAIDAEDYRQANQLLTRVLEINPWEPAAWAYHAVIAHLQGHYHGEQALRDIALARWPENYAVDYLIGQKLSQKYRFREGVAYQRRALERRANFLPAKFQLAHDLLRLGDEQEGWRLANEVQQQDNYHVVAFNLMTLKGQLERFGTLESEHFVVRMDAREAEIYGQQVVALLEEAYGTLCPKYDAQLSGPVYVEIFPRQEDFAIRTFGLPGGAGYLGVCFGRLITANSPASQGPNPTNWQSVLWHEFCHVVTLQKTENRMPRWLSEGISVYEERQRHPAWGQQLTPAFRQMMLGDELTPVSQLSGAFLRPRSPLHLQFAYYESSLVVEYLIEQIGPTGLSKVLADLAVGMPIEESLQRYLGPMTSVDAQFAQYARAKAEADAPSLDWQADLVTPETTPVELAALRQQHPKNYYLLLELARAQVRDADWAGAATHLEVILAARPHDTAALQLAARVQRELEDREAERQALEQWIQVDADATEALTRLADLAREKDDWPNVRQCADRILAINPMLASAQQLLADAAMALEDYPAVIAAQQALLQMEPADPAAVHYRLALAHERLGDRQRAKRQVLMALEEAPRYRDAHRLLLRLLDPPAQEPTHE